MCFSIKLRQDRDGLFCALCPELGLMANGRNRAEASDRLTSLIMEWLERRQSFDKDREHLPSVSGSDYDVFPLSTGQETKLLIVPKDRLLN
ncbi:hypothetical protein IKW72_02405 [bacterium]|nr:hypothetical protein [bacterium]